MQTKCGQVSLYILGGESYLNVRGRIYTQDPVGSLVHTKLSDYAVRLGIHWKFVVKLCSSLDGGIL